MATHSSILAWRIPWTEETGGLQSMRATVSPQTVGYDWAAEHTTLSRNCCLPWECISSACHQERTLCMICTVSVIVYAGQLVLVSFISLWEDAKKWVHRTMLRPSYEQSHTVWWFFKSFPLISSHPCTYLWLETQRKPKLKQNRPKSISMLSGQIWNNFFPIPLTERLACLFLLLNLLNAMR